MPFYRRKKIKKLFAGSGSVRMVKNCDLGQHFQDLGHSFSLYGPPSRQITYISVIQCWTPTNGAHDDEKKYCSTLQVEVAKIPNQDLLLVVGDTKAKVGSENNK